MTNKTLSNDAMDALRRKYAERLRERIQWFDNTISPKAGQLTPEQIEDVRNQAHSLVGSGTTYGYPDITKAARAVEEAIINGASPAIFMPMAKKMIEICRSVSATQAPPNNPQGIPVIKKRKDPPPHKKLLVIDDDLSVHEFIKAIFKDEFIIASAANGKEGIEAVQKEKPDLVLLDGDMPKMSGMALLEAFQNDEALKSIPVVMLTAHNKDTYVSQAVAAGILGYIVKPFNTDDLSMRVRKFISQAAKKAAGK